MIRRPFLIAHFDDELGLHPVVLRAGGYRALGRRQRTLAALQLRGDFLQLLLRKAGAHAPRIDQLAVLISGDVQRAEAAARALALRVAHHHEIGDVIGADLEPLDRAAAAVRPGRLPPQDSLRPPTLHPRVEPPAL